MTETTSPMHQEAASSPESSAVKCGTCPKIFTPKKRWQRFCGPTCRTAFHTHEARVKALHEASPRLLAALQLIAAGADTPVAIATAAIQGLKAP